MFNSITIFDALIIIAYLIIVLSLGLYFSRKKENSYSGYFLAGRSLGWFTVGMSIFATNISSEHFIGLAGSAASRGLVVGQFELMAIFILVLLGWVISPIYLKSGITTVPEFLEQRFDRSSRKIFAAISVGMYIFTKISVTLFASGILFNKIFGINIYASAIIIVLITGIYSVIGGAEAVSKTHIFQGLLMLAGAMLLTTFGLQKAGGFAGLQEKLPSDFFTMFKPIADADYPWTGIIFGAPIIAFWYWCTDTYIVQRLLGARSIEDARRGSLLAAFLKITPIFILVLPGIIAVCLYPEIKGDEAYPVLLASDIIPSGIKGIVLAGLLAAIMSSLASAFNSASAIFTNDFYKLKHPEANDRKLVLIGRLSTTIIVIAAILFVPIVKIINAQIYLYLQSVQAYVSPPITAIFISGLFFKRANAKGAFWTLIIGEIIGLSRLSMDLLVNMNILTSPALIEFTKFNFMHFAVVLFVISSILMAVISIATENKQEKTSKVQLLIDESLADIKLAFTNFRTKTIFRSNIYFSILILLVIIGIWSLWN
ncbi:MAG TPA: sodium:solute symporter [Ignavibacteriaceae bacterium]|nr:sodium:solute symporter [Ignavibacteriaceae bacterium]